MTRKQRRQRSDAKLYTYNGRTMTIKQWADELGITTVTIRVRLREHRPPEEVFATDRRVGDDYGKDKKKYFRRLEREAEEREFERWKGENNGKSEADRRGSAQDDEQWWDYSQRGDG